MVPFIHHDSSEGEQWGRYILPRYIMNMNHVLFTVLNNHKVIILIMNNHDMMICHKNVAIFGI